MKLSGLFEKTTTGELEYFTKLQEQYQENKELLYRLTTRPRILQRGLQSIENALENKVEKAKQSVIENKYKTSEKMEDFIKNLMGE